MSEPKKPQSTDNESMQESVNNAEVEAQSNPAVENAQSDTQSEAALESDKQSNSESDSDADSADAAALEDQLASAQAEIADLKDAFLRAKAEQDNIRRRSEKEVSNGRKFAVEGFAKELMNVRDSLQLANTVELAEGLGLEETQAAVVGMREGVGITLKQLDAAFAKYNLQEISPQTGDKLDPNLHQAMSLVESEDVDSGNIISVIQCGFTLHERLLRPAMVIVAK